jgi:hypothetical protein
MPLTPSAYCSDDDYITRTGYLKQDEGYTPILTGFYYISKLFRREIGSVTERDVDAHVLL